MCPSPCLCQCEQGDRYKRTVPLFYFTTKKRLNKYPAIFIRMMVELMQPTPDGLRVICAGLNNDPEKIGTHMLEMLAKFRNEGIVE